MINWRSLSVCLFCSGGVITPGVAFAKTNIIRKLIDNGLVFEVADTVKQIREK